jgi:hypothetical protein
MIKMLQVILVLLCFKLFYRINTWNFDDKDLM